MAIEGCKFVAWMFNPIGLRKYELSHLSYSSSATKPPIRHGFSGLDANSSTNFLSSFLPLELQHPQLCLTLRQHEDSDNLIRNLHICGR